MAETYEQMLMNQSAANSAFNANQAQINRDWQEYMSATSHQRETQDLIAAGLNPVLSANSGSTWSNVANATADPSSVSGMAALYTTMLNNAAALKQSEISAQATKAAAGATAAATMSAAAMNSSATRYAAEQSLEASKNAAQKSLEASQYSANKGYEGKVDTSLVGIGNLVANALLPNVGMDTASSITQKVHDQIEALGMIGNQ